jgi:hypothetical protein
LLLRVRETAKWKVDEFFGAQTFCDLKTQSKFPIKLKAAQVSLAWFLKMEEKVKIYAAADFLSKFHLLGGLSSRLSPACFAPHSSRPAPSSALVLRL